MRIFYLITKSEIGGAQTHIYQLSRYFIKRGEKIAVMSYLGGWLEKKMGELGIKFYPNKYLFNEINLIRDFKTIKEIKKAIKDFRPDLISCHSTKAGFLGRLVVKNKIPTIFTAHGWGFTPGVPWWRRYPVLLAEKIAARFCSKIICVSEFDKKLALKYKIASPEKIVTIHNGMEIQAEFPREIDPNKIKIVFVGRLGRQKDPLLLIKGFNELSFEIKNKVQISIIGEGIKRKELERFIEENKLEKKIKLLGRLPRKEVFEILKKSHIFVLISNWEGFPYTVIEAMSCGLGIIASDVGGIREAIDEKCGILIKRGDKEELKKALEKLLKNPELIQEMGRAAQEKTVKEFSLEKMLKKTNEIYKTL
ncbi:MAG: glycosyltransferase family 4 protein [Candidatus Nealsonbacteria bacterium]